tara:strand:- start:397 stop:603 length:207 start_codon:yes stop_codon:yes gene_type:complete
MALENFMTKEFAAKFFSKDQLGQTTFFEWLDEALTFAGDNKTSDIRTLELQTGEGNTKTMYAVRVSDA